MPVSTFFLSCSKKFEFRDSLQFAFTTSISTMGAQEIEAKKRKRKHSSKKTEEAAAPKKSSNGVEKADKPRKKAKKEHTPEPEVEDEVAEVSDEQEEEDEEVEGEEDEEKLNEELKQIAKQAKKSKKADADESDDEQKESANPNDLPLGTSMPTVEDPKLFSELKLSDRTMEAIKSMGFETMTEIQQKTIPPLLR